MVIRAAAVYVGGVLRLEEKLDLPDNTLVHLEIKPVQEERPVPDSLFGAFPELTVLARQDVQWVKRALERGLDRSPDSSEGA